MRDNGMRGKGRRAMAVGLAMLMLVTIAPRQIKAADGDVAISDKTFPDKTFRDLVKTKYDTNNDDVLSTAELDAVTSIREVSAGVKSVEGIEYFTKLESLNIYSNQITKLDVSQNKELTMLHCSANPIEELDLSNNPKLEDVECIGCKTKKIISGPAVTALACQNSGVEQLDVSRSTKLDHLTCNGNAISTLDLSTCAALEQANADVTNQNVSGTLRHTEDGKYVFDMGALVGIDKISQVTMKDQGTLDTKTGLVEYTTRPTNSEIIYEYDTKNPKTGIKVPVIVKTKLKCNIMFDSKGGSVVPSQVIDENGVVAKPTDPTKDGYTFAGWQTKDGKDYNFATPVTGDMTLNATWKKKVTMYNVTFDSKGGSKVAPQKVEEGKVAVKPTNPTRSGYVFAGWKDKDGKVYDFHTPVTKDITLYAGWTKYTVSMSRVSIGKVSNRVYSGYKITPSVTVKYQRKTLKKGKDYTVSYKNNVKVGTGKITIKGRGIYTGSKTVSFKITKRKKFAKGYYTVKAHVLCGHSKPSMSSKVKAYFKRGQRLEVLKVMKKAKHAKYTWLKVKGNKKVVYVYAKYIKL